jgi:hypothetical protein
MEFRRFFDFLQRRRREQGENDKYTNFGRGGGSSEVNRTALLEEKVRRTDASRDVLP